MESRLTERSQIQQKCFKATNHSDFSVATCKSVGGSHVAMCNSVGGSCMATCDSVGRSRMARCSSFFLPLAKI